MFNRARVGLFLIASALSFALPASALESASASYRNTRSSVDNGGRRKTSASYRLDSAAGGVSVSTASSASYLDRDGIEGERHYPGKVTGLLASSWTATGELYAEWIAPGNDGYEAGTTVKGYVVKYSTKASESPALNDAAFNAAASLTPPAPLVQGSKQTKVWTGLTAGASYYLAVKAVERDGLRSPLSDGATAYLPGTAPSFPSLWFVALTSAGLQYGTIGADGYVVQASTASDFTGVTLSSTVFGAQDRTAPQGLDPNTTYYLRAGALWGGATTYNPAVVTAVTLAKPVSGLDVRSVYLTSMTVTWQPLPSAPPQASSESASGYVLEVSTRADFAPLWTSSATAGVSLSTLSASGLVGGTTYYFRTASLNWSGAPDYSAAISSLMPVQLGVEMTTHTLSLPGLTNMASTIQISTSIILTNTGNVPETYRLRATTTTAGSPWTIGATPGVDRFTLWTVVNSTAAGAPDYGAEDKLSDVEAACGAAAFSMGNQTCVQVPVGATRTIWLQLATPLATSTASPQDISITARAVKDP